MILNVFQALKSPGEIFPFTITGEVEPQDVLGEQVHFDQVQLVGTFRANDNQDIEISGSLSTSVHTRCAKCLEKASAKVSASFFEVFTLTGDPDDLDVFLYRGNEVDLHRLMFTTAILALPIRFLCKENCKGLCAGCGGDLNQQGCTCEQHVDQENPFAVLKQLLNQDEGV